MKYNCNLRVTFSKWVSFKAVLCVFQRFLRISSNPESVKLAQVDIDSPTMQPCTVCLGASCSDGLRQLATP